MSGLVISRIMETLPPSGYCPRVTPNLSSCREYSFDIKCTITALSSDVVRRDCAMIQLDHRVVRRSGRDGSGCLVSCVSAVCLIFFHLSRGLLRTNFGAKCEVEI